MCMVGASGVWVKGLGLRTSPDLQAGHDACNQAFEAQSPEAKKP